MTNSYIQFNILSDLASSQLEEINDLCMDRCVEILSKTIIKVPKLKIRAMLKTKINNDFRSKTSRQVDILAVPDVLFEDEFISYNPRPIVPLRESQDEDANIEESRHAVAHYLQTRC